MSNGKAVINPWFIAVTVTLATFMELLDTSIANVALPYIGGGLGRSYDEVTWILTTYLVANAVILPMSAWLSRVFGRKTYYLGCVALFTLTSLFCGLAPSLGVMLSSRVLQGIAGGGLAPVSQAILVDTFPAAKRASAFALYTIVIVTAPAIGPVLGGWITDNYNWRWIFFINIPIGFLSLFLSSRLLKDPPAFELERASVRTNGKLSIDGIGITLIALASATLEVALDRGQIEDWFGSSFICWMLAIGVIGWIATVVWEMRVKEPVIDQHGDLAHKLPFSRHEAKNNIIAQSRWTARTPCTPHSYPCTGRDSGDGRGRVSFRVSVRSVYRFRSRTESFHGVGASGGGDRGVVAGPIQRNPFPGNPGDR
jgi:DHA2 family multidrug resistance protein